MTLFLTLLFGGFAIELGNAQNYRVRQHQKPSKTQNKKNKSQKTKVVSSVTNKRKPKVEIENYDFFTPGAPAMNLPKPRYPKKARAKKISGTVKVEIVVDEKGRVIWAKAVSGHKLLQKEAVRVSYQAKFSPVKIAGRPVKVSSTIPYDFLLEEEIT